MSDRPVAVVLPPEHVDRVAAEPVPLSPLPRLSAPQPLTVGIAAIDHSGRLRDRAVMTALAWRAGDPIAVQVHPTAIALRRVADGPFRLDGRVQAFIPAGTRALFGLRTGDRVTLVAAPAQDLLLVHPMTVLTDVLASYDASLLAGNRVG